MTKCRVETKCDMTTCIQCHVCHASLHVECVKTLMAEHFQGELYGETFSCDQHYTCVMDLCIPEIAARRRSTGARSASVPCTACACARSWEETSKGTSSSATSICLTI
jgi:hypothetical protein